MIVKGGGVNMNPKTKYLLISLLVLIIGCSPVAVYADTNTTAKYDPYKLVPWDKIALNTSRLLDQAFKNTSKLVNWYINPDNDIPFCTISLKDVNWGKMAAGDFSSLNEAKNKAIDEFKVVYNMPLFGSLNNKSSLQIGKTTNSSLFDHNITKIKISTKITFPLKQVSVK
jgi:hypothetical protein